MNYINLNGKILPVNEAHLPVDNGAFRYGYGLFETMLVQNGAISLKNYHWERLFAGARQLCFEMPSLLTASYLEQQVLQTIRKNKLESLCRVRLQLFAGGNGLYGTECTQPGFVIECYPLDAGTTSLNQNGLVLGMTTGLCKSMDSLSNLKSCNALIYAIAARQAKAHKWNDALISNSDNNIIETTIANIFWIKDNTIYTPPLSDGCVAGVMRRHVMERTAVKEKSLTIEDLLQADEVFLTNAIKKMRWVGSINDTHYTNETIQGLFSKLYPIG